MKIKVIIPNFGMDSDTLSQREIMLSSVALQSTQISVECIEEGPDVIQSHSDEVFAAIPLIKQGIRAESQGYDALIVYCFSDVGLQALREQLSIPVIGPGESALAWASLISDKFLVITTTAANIPRIYRRLMNYPFARERMVSIKSLEITVQDLRKNPEFTINKLREVIEESRLMGSFDTVILGCLGMAEYGDVLGEELGVNIIDPAFVAVLYAEMTVRMRMIKK